MNQRQAFFETIEQLARNDMDACEIEQAGCSFDHFLDMQRRIIAADRAGQPFSDAKLGRWLGWMQGAATARGFLTLEEAKEINKRNK